MFQHNEVSFQNCPLKFLIIKIQIGFRARTDCLQWFTGVTGTVESFNFGNGMIGTFDYTVCVRREVGYCGIEWSEYDTTSPDPFTLDDALTKGAGVSFIYNFTSFNFRAKRAHAI